MTNRQIRFRAQEAFKLWLQRGIMQKGFSVAGDEYVFVEDGFSATMDSSGRILLVRPLNLSR